MPLNEKQDTYERTFDVERSQPDSRDYNARLIYKSLNVRATSLPDAVDLRKKLGPCRNQGRQGACGAFAATAVREYQETVDNKALERGEYLAPQFVYLNRANYPKGGTTGRDLMRILKDVGVCREELCPYPEGGGTRTSPERKKTYLNKDMFREARKHKIASFARCDRVKDVKKALANDGPCIICVPVYGGGKYMWRPTDAYPQPRGGHAMTIVGYNERGFIIRNSWGPKWGPWDNGHTLFPYKDWGMHFEVWAVVDLKGSLPYVSV